jgi:deoxyribodipyrimidine photolyase-related protein
MTTLAFILGDQLDHDAGLLAGLDPKTDTILMAEVKQESGAEVKGEPRHAVSHAQRTVLFLSAMRHYAEMLRGRGFRVRYVEIDDKANTHTLSGELARAVKAVKPGRITLTEPGEWRLRREAEGWGKALGVPVEILDDGHFMCSHAEFEAWSQGRKELVMEYFYREQRRRHGILMGKGGKPVGGEWNFDKENREPFGELGPMPRPKAPPRFEPDEVTRAVIAAARRMMPELPGWDAMVKEGFAWAVTRADAVKSLRAFVRDRLATFGTHQDAMWEDEPFLSHSIVSSSINLKLLNPRECVAAAVAAHEAEKAPLNAVEGFVRQIIGWREFIRGVYWMEGEGYADRNGLEATMPLPPVYWTGRTRMNCMKRCVGEVLTRGFGHHIQRLMVTGNFALLAGVVPREVSDWYLGMYVDGVDWVTAPNVVGMALHADGGVVGTKPYAASGKYIERMSNYCKGCAYDVGAREGEKACPFNVLYWDFLIRHRDRFRGNRRMSMILSNVDKMPEPTRTQITVSAKGVRARLSAGTL